METRFSVLLLTEGTYPFAGGGVSTWCDALCHSLHDVDFHLFATVGTPNVAQKYELPENVRQLRKLPLWGCKETALFFQPEHSFTDVYLRRVETNRTAVQQKFIPAFEAFLLHILNPEHASEDASEVLLKLYQYFQRYDHRRTFQTELTWSTFKRVALEHGSMGAREPSLSEMTDAMRWLTNFLLPLTATIPETDVTHATVAGFCGLSGIIASRLYNTPMIITDHGVYARERYLAISQEDYSPFAKRFLTSLSLFVTRQCYRVAEQVSPVCNYNHRWEKPLGATSEKIQTIYNGIQTDEFVPGPKPSHTRGRPTVVAAAHVFPLKDIETMIRSCDVARQHVPDVLYRVYGSLEVDPSYVRRCRALIRKLNLEEHFEFGGYHSEPKKLYLEGDISVLSSVSEGFPYAVLESMSCARPVVATDVGGVREAIGEHCGIVVKPCGAKALGRGVAELLCDDERRRRMGREARARVLEKFRLSACVAAYRKTYRTLVSRKLLGSTLPDSRVPVGSRAPVFHHG